MKKSMSIFGAIFFATLILTSCGESKNYTDCECEILASDAIIHAAGIGDDREVNIKGLEACSKRLIEEQNFKFDADELSIDYLSQYYYQKCKNGFYEKIGK